MRKAFKNEVGITLIALVVTIVILLILAGITINAIMGEGGLINRAKIAENKTAQGAENDINAINNLANQAEELINGGESKALAGTIVAKPSGWTSTKATPIADGNGGTVPLPSGFYYIGGDYNTGLVISDKQDDTMNASGTTMGNQFVWIPVPNEGALTCTFFGENGQPYTEERVREITNAEIAERLSNGSLESIREILMEQFKTNFPIADFPNNPPEDWEETFPIEIPNNDTADDYENYMNACTNYALELEYFYTQLDNYMYEHSEFSEPYAEGYLGEEEEYNTMRNQVLKYGGFYVGRYEAGVSNTTLRTQPTIAQEVVSKKGVAPYNYVPWGTAMNNANEITGESGAVYLAKNMYTNHESVTSTLVYGCQWDAMCRYIGDSQRESSTQSIQLTGSDANNVSKNIYDLAGNCYEWTMEATINQGSNVRVLRSYGHSSPIYGRLGSADYPTDSDGETEAFRCTLYIK